METSTFNKLDFTQNKQHISPKRVKQIIDNYWAHFIRETYISRDKEQIILQSNLGINKPWYCNSTGHMNAIELNLAFNQMMYIVMGESIDLGWIKNLNYYSFSTFLSKHWADFLIVKITSEFKKPLMVNNFCGTLRIVSITPSSNHLWFELDLSLKPGNECFSFAR